MSDVDFDAIVIGGGHAGIEAALALSRLSFKTLMITQHLDAIGRLSCNPAVGGLSKGNIVREIDALGGEMGRLIDATMIQFRILNRRRGPAVQAPRAQADKYEYSSLAKQTLERQDFLDLFQDTVVDILTEGTQVGGVLTERGRRFTASTVVLTTGTFMEAVIFIGDHSSPSGRLGEPAAGGLGKSLREKGFDLGRLKTGTPARVARSSLDFDKMEVQAGEELRPFSFGNDAIDRPNEACYITFTNDETHRIIRENIDRSPLYGGKIVGVGPRYCPSIEDKVMRFPDRDRHQVFVEPEGWQSEEMYLNGISSSLPEEVQERFLRTLPGLEHLHVMRPGYAVEYDYLDPRQLYPSLETKRIDGLFVAGQTNGTSGYEEAACQGLMAGINAALRLRGEPPLILSRDEAYTGVLIDDLVTLGTEEPYRMFTSRAEYRLSLRHDSADMRLLPKGYEIGLQDRTSWERFQEKCDRIRAIKDLLHDRRLTGEEARRHKEFSGHDGKTFDQLLKVPGIGMDSLDPLLPELEGFRPEFREQAELDIRYEGYIARQEKQIGRFRRMERLKIPREFEYDALEGISAESKEKLKKVRPLSVGQASRISGVRNSDIAVLLVMIERRKSKKENKNPKDGNDG